MLPERNSFLSGKKEESVMRLHLITLSPSGGLQGDPLKLEALFAFIKPSLRELVLRILL